MLRLSKHAVVFSLGLMLCTGCIDEPKPSSSAAKGPPKLKTTQDVGEFNAGDGKEISDSKVKVTNPLTAGLEAYQPLKEQVAGFGVDKAISLFHALEGRYPKDHAEFMSAIVKQNNLRLPKLPAGKSYEYDVANHKLLIVLDKPAEK